MVVGPTLKRTQKVTEVEIGDPREDGFSLTWGLLHFVAFAILCSNSPNVVVRFRMIIGEIIIVVGSLANLCWVSQFLAACHCKQDLCCLTSG